MMLLPPIAGRQADILFLHTDAPTQRRLVQQSLTLHGGVAVAGIEKLAARVTLRLLTPLGGQIYASQEGTQFMSDVLAGRLQTVAAVRQSFARAKETLLDQFVADLRERPDTPADERLVDINLLNVQANGDSIDLKIEIQSATRTYEFVQPVKV